MKILLYGGTFDPPHTGHVNNLMAAIRCAQPDRVIVLPAGVPPHKKASTTPGEIRAEMCRCFLPCFPALEVSDWEIRQEGKSYSIHTLEHFHQENPDAQLFLAIGSDMLLTFTEWYRWQDILRLATLVVTSRKNGDMEELHAAAAGLEQEGGTILFAEAEPVELSSTDIRTGKADWRQLPEPVPAIIRRYHLYQQNEEGDNLE